MKFYMKKIHILVYILIFSFLIIILNINFYNNKKDDRQKIENVIQVYFDNELKSIKTLTPVYSNYIIINPVLQKYNTLQTNYYVLCFIKVNHKLNKYTLYIHYNKIRINKNSCTVTLEKGTDMLFDNDNGIAQKARGDKYTIVLTKVDTKWFIRHIISDDDINYQMKLKLDIGLVSDSDINNITTKNLNNLQNQYNKIISNKLSNKIYIVKS